MGSVYDFSKLCILFIVVKSFQLEERSSGSGKTEDVWFLDLFRREPNSGAVASVCCCWFIWYVLVSKFGANLVAFSLLICLWFRNSVVESLAISSLFLIRVSIKCSRKCVDINMIWSEYNGASRRLAELWQISILEISWSQNERWWHVRDSSVFRSLRYSCAILRMAESPTIMNSPLSFF